MTRRTWLAACAVLLVACASSNTGEDADFDAPPKPAQSRVIVRNDYLGDLELFILTGSIRNRIGWVTTGGSAEFSIPARYMVRPDIQFQLAPAGASTTPFTYQPIAMSHGSVIELRATRVLTMSTYQILGH